jgi:uncharacterized hydrophobic protein (TIGR00271 family)
MSANPGGAGGSTCGLELTVPAGWSRDIELSLRSMPAVGHVEKLSTADGRSSVLRAEVDAGSTEAVRGALVAAGVSDGEISLAQGNGRRSDEPIWADLLGEARASSRVAARYLALMAAAGVVATFGVIDKNAILIVGAMAISPDLEPICATCVGISQARWRLARRGLATFGVGLAAIGLVALAITLLLDTTNSLPPDFSLGQGGIGLLASIDLGTIAVAAAGGVAGMLAYETRAAQAVGVGISVTTITVATYLGVAAGLNELTTATSALGVLGANVVFIILAGTITLLIQRRFQPRAANAAAGRAAEPRARIPR